jgi:hypothetical protein
MRVPDPPYPARSAGSSNADKRAPPIGTKPSPLLRRCNSPALWDGQDKIETPLTLPATNPEPERISVIRQSGDQSAP